MTKRFTLLEKRLIRKAMLAKDANGDLPLVLYVKKDGEIEFMYGQATCAVQRYLQRKQVQHDTNQEIIL